MCPTLMQFREAVQICRQKGWNQLLRYFSKKTSLKFIWAIPPCEELFICDIIYVSRENPGLFDPPANADFS